MAENELKLFPKLNKYDVFSWFSLIFTPQKAENQTGDFDSYSKV